MAVADLPADDRGAAGENTLPLGVISHPVILINEGQVNRQVGQHQVDLLQRHPSRIQTQSPGNIWQRLYGLGWLRLWLFDNFFRPALVGDHPGKTDVGLALFNLDPLLLRKHIQAGRKKNVLFLVDHVPDGLDGFFQRRHGLYRIIFGKCLPGLFHVRPDIIVDGPHHLGGPGKVVGLQHRKELVFFACVMGVDLGQPFDEGAQRLTVFFKGLRAGRLSHAPHEHADFTHDLLRSPVFLHKGVDRVAQRSSRPVLFL